MADPRFATTEQIDEVEGYAEAIAAYQAKFTNVLKTIAGYIEAFELTFDNPAGLEIRYITGEGRDDENWRGHLLSASPSVDGEDPKVNVWCLTITGTRGEPFGEGSPVGSFDKPFTIGVDYFYDWDFGQDNVEVNDNLNSEEFFNKKVDGIDFIFEKIRSCLPDEAEILEWDFRRGIKRFTNASTHWAKGDLSLKFSGE